MQRLWLICLYSISLMSAEVYTNHTNSSLLKNMLTLHIWTSPPIDWNHTMIPSIGELREALRRSKATAPGINGVHYVILRNLAPSAESLLRIYNKCWLEGMFPVRWHRALLLPFLKPNKPPQLPSSHRPITLTSCMCKVRIERIVNM